MMSKVYCHNCGKDYDGKDGERVCVHITIGGTEAIHAKEEKVQKEIELAKKQEKLSAQEKTQSKEAPKKESS